MRAFAFCVAVLLAAGVAQAEPAPGSKLEGDRAAALQAANDAGRAGVRAYLSDLKEGMSEATEPAFDRVVATLGEIQTLHCSGPAATRPDFCATLVPMQCDVRRLVAERIISAADKAASSDSPQEEQRKNYGRAGDLYRALGETAACPRRAELLYNAGKSYQASRSIDLALRAFEQLIALPAPTELAAKAMYAVGSIYQATADYEQAASAYERFAEHFPKDDKAREALSDAVVLRLGLHQMDAAQRDVDAFSKTYGASSEAAKVEYAMAASLAEQVPSDPVRTRKALMRAAQPVLAKGSRMVQLCMGVLLARSAIEAHKDADARKELARVLALGETIGKKDEIGFGPGLSEDQRMREMGRSLSAVGEALFLVAGQNERASKRETAPAADKLDDAGFQTWIEGGLKTWADRRVKTDDLIEKAYGRVVEIQPEPPPRWVIAASTRVAIMRIDFASEIQALTDKASSPARAKKLAAFAAPHVARAKSAVKQTLELSTKLEFLSDERERLEAWLAKVAPKEMRPIIELIAPPRFRGVSLGPPSPVPWPRSPPASGR